MQVSENHAVLLMVFLCNHSFSEAGENAHLVHKRVYYGARLAVGVGKSAGSDLPVPPCTRWEPHLKVAERSKTCLAQ